MKAFLISTFVALITMAAALPTPSPAGMLETRSCAKDHEYWCQEFHGSHGEICIIPSAKEDSNGWSKIYDKHVCCSGKISSSAGSDGKFGDSSYDSISGCNKI